MKGPHKTYREIKDGLFATISYPAAMVLLTGIRAIQQDNTGKILAQGADGTVYDIGKAKENNKILDLIDIHEKNLENWLLHYLLTTYSKKFGE